MTEIVAVVDDPVHPVGSVQLNVYGAVPPAGEAVQLNALPLVNGAVHVTLLVSGAPCTVTEVEALTRVAGELVS